MISPKLLALLRTLFIGNPEELETDNKHYITNAINELNATSKILDIGLVQMPNITRNTNGTIDIFEGGIIVFNSENGLTGIRKKITMPQQQVSITDNSLGFLYADYNSGSPEYRVSYTSDVFGNDPTKVNVCRVVREGAKIHFTEYGETGIYQSEQHLIKDIKLRGIERQSGFGLGVNGLVPVVSSGKAYFGLKTYSMPELDVSNVEILMYEYYLSDGNWLKSNDLSSLDNSYYSDGTNRLNLTNNKYVSKYIFIDIGDDKEIYYVHGNQYNTLNGAVNEVKPEIPLLLQAHTLYVGKIVVQQGKPTGIAYSRTWGESVLISIPE